MRKLILLVGPPAAGKSSFIRENQLEPWTLSSDEFRLRIQRPILTFTSDGPMYNGISLLQIPGQVSMQAFDELHKEANFRMSKWETLFIDATNLGKQAIDPFLKLVDKHGYELYYVPFDFKSIEKLKNDNWDRNKRGLYRTVPEADIERIQARLPDSIEYLKAAGAIEIPHHSALDVLMASSGATYFSPEDKSPTIFFIGDVQGCHQALVKMLDELRAKFGKPDKICFTGDLLDRGPSNVETLEFVFNLWNENQDDVIVIEGNHDLYLRNWVYGRDGQNYSHWLNTTGKDLEAVKDQREKYRPFVDSFVPLKMFFLDKKYIIQASHGGFPGMLVGRDLLFLDKTLLLRGYKGYDFDVDTEFERNMIVHPYGHNMYQVHGHRNMFFRDPAPRATTRSFNLEGRVEFGGELRAVVWKDKTMTTHTVTNSHYNVPRSPTQWEAATGWKEKYDSRQVTLPLESIDTQNFRFRIPDGQSILCVGHARNVEYTNAWDSISTRCRGMFYLLERPGDKNTRIGLISRGYNKFDYYRQGRDYGEGVFPVKAFRKYNGFFGTIGAHADLPGLKFFSKTSTGNNYSQWFEDIVMTGRSGYWAESLRRWLVDNHACLAFEVEDVENDVHIVNPPKMSRVTLLACIARTDDTFEEMPYDQLKVLASMFGFDVKELVFEAKSYTQLNADLERLSEKNSSREEFDEGLILEFNNGEKAKVKHPSYTFWKQIRGLVMTTRLASNRESDGNYDPSVITRETQNFIRKGYQHLASFLLQLPVDQMGSLTIPELRAEYLKYEANLDHTQN